ncbi:hypothetical protein HAX54_036338, partial [Datura stramonium]|nr:hypothetical protein [Datura stramonium]
VGTKTKEVLIVEIVIKGAGTKAKVCLHSDTIVNPNNYNGNGAYCRTVNTRSGRVLGNEVVEIDDPPNEQVLVDELDVAERDRNPKKSGVFIEKMIVVEEATI